jgi:hypothetical protein
MENNSHIQGHLLFLSNKKKRIFYLIIKEKYVQIIEFLYLATSKNDYLSNENLVQRIILNKTTLHDSLGISIIVLKHCQLNIYAVFIDNIQSNSLAHL